MMMNRVALGIVSLAAVFSIVTPRSMMIDP